MGSKIRASNTAPDRPSSDTRATPSPLPGTVSRSVAADPVQTDDGRGEPADGRQEGKGLVRLPGAAVVAAEPEAAPVEGVAAGAAEPVDEQAEGGEPADGQYEVGGPVGEGAREGEEPEEGEEDGEAGDDLDEDEAAERPGGLAVLGV